MKSDGRFDDGKEVGTVDGGLPTCGAMFVAATEAVRWLIRRVLRFGFAVMTKVTESNCGGWIGLWEWAASAKWMRANAKWTELCVRGPIRA